jgi:hypothetical protein
MEETRLRVKLMRRWVVGVAALVAAAAFVPGARADEGLWRNFRGRIVFTDIALAPEANFENPALMTPALKRLERSTIDQTAGFWRIHVLAFMDRPVASRTLVLRASDVSDPNAPREVHVFEVPIERGAKELRMDDFVVTTGMGFEAGRSYQLAFEAPPEEATAAGETRKAGKADVYAKGVITLR